MAHLQVGVLCDAVVTQSVVFNTRQTGKSPNASKVVGPVGCEILFTKFCYLEAPITPDSQLGWLRLNPFAGKPK